MVGAKQFYATAVASAASVVQSGTQVAESITKEDTYEHSPHAISRLRIAQCDVGVTSDPR